MNGRAASIALALAGATLAAMASAAPPVPSSLPRVEARHLAYLGAFRMPSGEGATSTFEYGGTALAFNPARGSLFVTGHDWHQRSAEISIPEPRIAASVAQLPRAGLLQAFVDVTEGRLRWVNPSDQNPQKIGGHLVQGDRLIVSVYSYYDGEGAQVASHFVRPIDLSARGNVIGPVRIGRAYPGFVSGYMTPVPPEWQPTLGAPALTGNCCLAIASIQSNGPSVSTFDPGELSSGRPASSKLLVGYPLGEPLGPGETTRNPLYNLTTRIRGLVFPPGTRSVLFIGRHGTGPYCYGSGAECGDPADDSKGTHAWPYRYQVWAYDANDLAAARRGVRSPGRVQPYAVWNFALPFEDGAGERLIGGAAYDPATRRLYVSQQCADDGCTPLIHAFELRIGGQAASP